jgi:hypothetical protein
MMTYVLLLLLLLLLQEPPSLWHMQTMRHFGKQLTAVPAAATVLRAVTAVFAAAELCIR